MFSIYDPWAPLTDVMVGTCQTHLTLPWIADPRTRHQLETILHETQEDLDYLAQYLGSQGVQIHRPSAPTNSIDKPIISPRDHVLVIEDMVFVNDSNFLSQFPAATFAATISSSTVHYFGTSLCLSRDVDKIAAQKLFSNYELIWFYQPGHIDGWFTIPTPGLIISGRDYQRTELLDLFYRKNFSDHEVVYVGETLAKVDWGINRKNPDWIIPDPTLTDFVNQYLESWSGTPEETIFEINMLILDSKNVVVNCIDDTVATALQRYNITAHVIPFRHAAFWDCGIHCATADLSRKKVGSLSPRPPAHS